MALVRYEASTLFKDVPNIVVVKLSEVLNLLCASLKCFMMHLMFSYFQDLVSKAVSDRRSSRSFSQSRASTAMCSSPSCRE